MQHTPCNPTGEALSSRSLYLLILAERRSRGARRCPAWSLPWRPHWHCRHHCHCHWPRAHPKRPPGAAQQGPLGFEWQPLLRRGPSQSPACGKPHQGARTPLVVLSRKGPFLGGGKADQRRKEQAKESARGRERERAAEGNGFHPLRRPAVWRDPVREHGSPLAECRGQGPFLGEGGGVTAGKRSAEGREQRGKGA